MSVMLVLGTFNDVFEKIEEQELAAHILHYYFLLWSTLSQNDVLSLKYKHLTL